jgi:uncharacterized protein YndB with AHSA1/START domain
MTDQADRTLSVTTFIAAPPDKVWHVMTQRQEDWWCPRPWTIEIIEQDWRPGGRSAIIMRGPDGEEEPHEGVFLEVVPGRRFISTDAFRAGWVPAGPFMVGTWEIAPEGTGTRYTASARHWTDEACERHEAMGFDEGWSTCAAQLKDVCEAD